MIFSEKSHASIADSISDEVTDSIKDKYENSISGAKDKLNKLKLYYDYGVYFNERYQTEKKGQQIKLLTKKSLNLTL